MADPITTVVVQRDNLVDTALTTHASMPDILVKVMSPFWVIVIRATRVYLQTLVGLLTAGATGMASTVLPATDFAHLLRICASLSVASAVMCALQNFVELLARLDEKAPQYRP